MTYKQIKKLKARVENTLKEMPSAPRKSVVISANSLAYKTAYKTIDIDKIPIVIDSENKRSNVPGSGHHF